MEFFDSLKKKIQIHNLLLIFNSKLVSEMNLEKIDCKGWKHLNTSKFNLLINPTIFYSFELDSAFF